MPYSYDDFKPAIRTFIRQAYGRLDAILDVGPGCGTYGQMLRIRNPRIDAIEIFPEYIEKFGLRTIYRQVFIGDIRYIDDQILTKNNYKLIVIGDVLEHLSVEDARAIVSRLTKYSDLLVAVPYCLPQGSVGGNDHEAHLQEDLTHEIFMERYDGFRCLFRNDRYGYYFRPVAKKSQ